MKMREDHQEKMKELDASKVFFVDECATNDAMVPLVELHAPSPLPLHPRWHSPQPRPRAGGRAAGFASCTTSN